MSRLDPDTNVKDQLNITANGGNFMNSSHLVQVIGWIDPICLTSNNHTIYKITEFLSYPLVMFSHLM